jgi:hypothetical protein
MDIFNYVSYEDLMAYQELESDIGTASINELKKVVLRASRMWNGSTARVWAAFRETRYYDATEKTARRTVSTRHAFSIPGGLDDTLRVDQDLLAVEELTTANDTVTLTDYFLMQGRLYGKTPYDRIVLDQTADITTFSISDTFQRANKVDGIWGYHDDYGNAWEDSADSVQDASGINDTVTTITVADVDGAGPLGITPRFKAQTMIRIESEYLFITATDTTLNTLTVIRGINGTTAAAHAKDVQIDNWKVQDDVFQIVQRLAAFLWAQKDSPFENIQINQQLGTITIPQNAPADVLAWARYYWRGPL